jgi:hypothetical protein
LSKINADPENGGQFRAAYGGINFGGIIKPEPHLISPVCQFFHAIFLFSLFSASGSETSNAGDYR